MNPGNGAKGGINADDQRQFEALQRVRNASETNALAAFDELTLTLADIMPRWKIHKNFVAPVLDAAGLEFSDVAYVNLLKWRTKASSGLGQLYKLSWDHHTRDQFDVLAPSRVIAVGVDAARAFEKHYALTVDFDFIPRVIGNNVGPESRVALARIKEKLSYSTSLGAV